MKNTAIAPRLLTGGRRRAPGPGTPRARRRVTDAQPVQPALVRSGYEGAGAGRLVGNWFPAGLDINALIAQSNPHMRSRVRDLVRNFPPFARAVNSMVAFVIGRGARFQSLAVTPSGEPDNALRAKIEDRFRAWMDTADITGKLHFYELQQLAQRQMDESGEAIGRFAKPRDKKRHPVAVQMFESEQLGAWHATGQEADSAIEQGVEFDIYTGEALAYHFQTSYAWQAMQSWREPASNVLHVYQMLRPGQMRGVTPFAPAIMLARDMGQYTGAEIDSAKLAAKYMAFIKTPRPDEFQAARTPGLIGASPATPRDDIDWMENAIVEYLREGEDIVIAPGSQRPGDSFDRFTRFILRMVAITMDVPYEILSGDYTGINYSTSKASRNDFSMFLASHQFRMETHFIRPIYRRWLEYEALTQDYMRGYFLNPERFQRAMWIPAGMASVDPLRDGKAYIDAIAAGIVSPQSVILARGDDPEEVIAQRVAWLRMCADAGLDATTGKVSTSMANNPAKLGAVEQLPEDRAAQTQYAA